MSYFDLNMWISTQKHFPVISFTEVTRVHLIFGNPQGKLWQKCDLSSGIHIASIEWNRILFKHLINDRLPAMIHLFPQLTDVHIKFI